MIDERLLNPKSIVLYGASEDKLKFSGRPLDHLIKYGYQGKIYPINPKYEKLLNFNCYKSVDEIPEDQIDLALILVSSRLILQALEQCGRKGIPYNIVVASGFAESGNHELQAKLIEIAKSYNIHVIGPNCLGIIHPQNGIVPTFSTVLMKEEKVMSGNIVLVTQSGALGNGLLQTFRDRGIGLHTMITTGNEADLSLFDFVEFFIEDQDTKVIGCFVEGLKDGERIVEIGQRALAKNKPIVMLIGGRSESGRQASSAHTAKIIGSGHELTQCVLDQAGIVSVKTLEELLDALNIFSKLNYTFKKGIGSLTPSGGCGVLLMDACDQLELEVAVFSNSTTQKLIDHIPPNITPRNPVDTINLDNKAYAKCVDIVLDDPNTSHIVMTLSSLAHDFDKLAEDFAKISKKAKSLEKTLSITFQSPSEFLNEEVRRKLAVDNVFSYENNPTRALKAIHSLAKLEKFKQSVNRAESTERIHVESRITKDKSFKDKSIEYLIESYDLPLPVGRNVNNRTNAVKEASRLGYPVVLKIQSPEIQHKTESGLVKLDLRNAEEVNQAFDEIVLNLNQKHPKVKFKGVHIEAMIKGGIECIVGISQSLEFGTILMFGSGGILTELIKDVSYRAFPLSERDIREMIEETRVYQLLKGFRRENPKDIDQLVKEIIKLIRMYEAEKWIKELEINPFIVLDQGKGVRAVDILIFPL
ncbi:acetate--CoA ligase family protein [Thermodesulfobacteriota bacterium]